MRIELEDGFDFGVDGDTRGGKAVDGVGFSAWFFGEVKETADVIILFEAGKEAFRLFN